MTCAVWQWLSCMLQGIPPVYDLYAVSNHYGGLGGGHYTAFAQVEGQGWAHFNDSDASPEQPSNVQSPAAYLLFYRRQAETAQDAPCALPLAFSLVLMLGVLCVNLGQMHGWKGFTGRRCLTVSEA